MARVTVEDCLGKIHNRFDLVLCVSKRAHQLAGSDAGSFVPLNTNEKPVVLALREVAAGYVHIDALGIARVQSPQSIQSAEEQESVE